MRTLASILPQGIKLALLKRHLVGSIDGERFRRELTLHDLPDKISPLRISLKKGNNEIAVGLDLEATMHRSDVYRMLYARLPSMLRVFSRSGSRIQMVAADLSDGNAPPAGVMAFCSCRDDVLLVPDPVFVNSGGYAQFRDPTALPAWSHRHDTILWRGTSTGIGEMTTETMDPNDLRLRQRVRMCLILRSKPGTDVRIHKAESVASALDRQRLHRLGLLGSYIAQAHWGRHKFALDIDGHTNAWSNFFVRLLLGCCVLKIQSEHGYRQWYYDRLRPWRHYVPVCADMSDLIEKIDWCRSHDAECELIGRAGQSVVQAMTVETEIKDAVGRLEAAQFTATEGGLEHPRETPVVAP
jgi:hypothetical protein